MRGSKLIALSTLVVAGAVSLPTTAAVVVFTTTLGSAGEPVPTSTATGSATVSFDNATNAISVNVAWSGLLGSGPFGHIHCCTALAGTGNAGVSQGFATLSNVATGNYIDTFSPAPANFTALLAGALAGKAYVNIHTAGTYSGGEIRGFLNAVPEPSALALTMLALGLAGVAARRKGA